MSDLRLAVEPPIGRIILDRPEQRNAMSAAMWRDLACICAEIDGRDEVEVVIVQGAGGHFCSGADIGEFDEVFATLESARGYLGSIERGLEALCRLDRPTLARIEGVVIGGGLAIALACDLRFAAEDAHLAAPPAKLGLLYGPVETRLLIETIGVAAAKDMLFSARRVRTDEAVQLGLINRRTNAAELDSAVERQARAWCELSQASIRGAKKAAAAVLAGDMESARAMLESLAMGRDFREGRAAFKEKRPPSFERGV
jgi:enoyl-CoA hydratase/carnithine racemase